MRKSLFLVSLVVFAFSPRVSFAQDLEDEVSEAAPAAETASEVTPAEATSTDDGDALADDAADADGTDDSTASDDGDALADDAADTADDPANTADDPASDEEGPGKLKSDAAEEAEASVMESADSKKSGDSGGGPPPTAIQGGSTLTRGFGARFVTQFSFTPYDANNSGYFQPVFLLSWAPGKKLIGDNAFKTLNLTASFNVSTALYGFQSQFYGAGDVPEYIDANGNPSRIPACTTAVPDSTGRILVNQGNVNQVVPRCDNTVGRGGRTDYGDLALTLAVPNIYKVPKIGVGLWPSFRVTAPTSLQSRSAGMILTVRPGLGLMRGLFGGKVFLSYSVGMNIMIHDSKRFRGQAAGDLQGTGFITNNIRVNNVGTFSRDVSELGSFGANNAAWNLANSFSATIIPVTNLFISAGYTFIDTNVRDISCSDVIGSDGNPIDTCANGDAVANFSTSSQGLPGSSSNFGGTVPTGDRSGSNLFRDPWRQAHVFNFAVSYQAKPWLNLSATVSSFGTRREQDNKPQQPFFTIRNNNNMSTEVIIGAVVFLDQAASAIVKKVKPAAPKVATRKIEIL